MSVAALMRAAVLPLLEDEPVVGDADCDKVEFATGDRVAKVSLRLSASVKDRRRVSKLLSPAREPSSVAELRHVMVGIAWVLCLDRRLIGGAAIPLLSTPAPALGIDDAGSAATASSVVSHALLPANSLVETCCALVSSP